MQKKNILAFTALSLVLLFLLMGTVSAASIWEPRYESYRLSTNSFGHSAGSYSSTSTYEKIETENEDRYGSDSQTVIRRSESETFVPAVRTETRRVYREDRKDYDYPAYRYLDNRGFGRTYVPRDTVINNDVYVDYHGRFLPSTNWRFKEVYHDYDYPNENSYGYDYYYAPRYDWHQGVYNWRY